MKLWHNETYGKEIAASAKQLARFRNDEGGSMIVFSMFLFMIIMIVAGMAVDFMRFESRRSSMQGALDNAVLAAANLDQELDPAEVVTDHLTKSQVGNCLKGEVIVEDEANYRKVEAECEMVLDTIFLRFGSFFGFQGMEYLSAGASSVGLEGVANIEVSLVLDISGSMGESVSGGGTRMSRMQEAGTAFVETLLQPEFEDKVSLSLISYSEDVNLGPDLYGTVTTEPFGTSADGSQNSRHTFSHCVTLPPADFGTTTWDNDAGYKQTPHFQFHGSYNSSGNLTTDIDSPTCPSRPYEEIIPISQDVAQLTGAISQLEPRGGTAIFVGLKWAVNLLDPSFRDNIEALPNGVIDEAFDGRPSDYGDGTGENETIKYIVLMTDGQNSSISRPTEAIYSDENHVAHWADMNFWYFFNYRVGGGRYRNVSEFANLNYYTSSQADTLMQSLCTAAKAEGIIIFGIAMESTANGEAQMNQCASSSGHYYETSGDEIVDIFEAIAQQITDLRLTQ